MTPLKTRFLQIFAASLLTAVPSNATLLFYEGFSADNYTAGAITGQPNVGGGYLANGVWNTASTFEEGGLSFPGLATTDGFSLSRSDGEVTALFDLTPTGPFGSNNLIGTNGLIGGTGITGTIYFSVLGNRTDTQAASFAGFNIFNGSAEGMGVGEVAGTNYSWLQNGSNGAIGDPPTALVNDDTRLFVFKLNYDAALPLTAKIWLNPDPLLSEDDQDSTISTDVTNVPMAVGFDSFKLRGSRVWQFDEIRIGTTWEDVTPSSLLAPPLIITDIGYVPTTDTVTLTWNSLASETYVLKYSTDLVNWDADVADGILADPGESTTKDFDLSLIPAIANAGKIFFRIEIAP